MASQERERAEENLKQAHQTVRDYLTIVSDSEELALPALQTLRSQLLESALSYFEQFIEQNPDELHLELEMAATYIRVAQVYVDIDRANDAVHALNAGLDILERLRRQHPDVARCPAIVSGFWRGFEKTALSVDTPIDSEAAMATLRRAINLWEELVAECPAERGFRSDLAVLRTQAADLVLTYLGDGMIQGDKVPLVRQVAQQDAERARVLLSQLVEEDSERHQYRADLARVYNILAKIAREHQQLDRVDPLRDRALALRESLVEQSPNHPRYRVVLAESLLLSASQHDKSGNLNQAEIEYRRAIDLAQPLVIQFPNVILYLQTLIEPLSDLATLLHRQGKNDEAWEKLQLALANLDRLAVSDRDKFVAGLTVTKLGNALNITGHKAEANRLYQSQMNAYAHLSKSRPTIVAHRWSLFHAQRMVGFTFMDLDQRRDAIRSFEEAHFTISSLATNHPDDSKYQKWLKDHLVMLTRLVGDQKPDAGQDDSGAERNFAEYLRPFDQAVDQSPDDWQAWHQRGIVHYNLKRWPDAAGDFAKAAELAPHRRLIYRNWASSLWPQERWQQAADVLVQAVNLDFNLAGWRERYELALCALAAGNASQYRDVCELMLEISADAKDPLQQNFAAWTSALSDCGSDQTELAVELATRAVTSQPENEQFLNTLGAALYRKGRYDEALDRLAQLTNREVKAGGEANSSPAYTMYFLAMTHHALDNVNEAKEWLQKADRRTMRALENEEQPPWNRILTLKLLREEAHSMIDSTELTSNESSKLSTPITKPATELPIAYGRLHALRGRWIEALDKYKGNVNLDRIDDSLFEYACLLLLADENDEYDRLCKQLAELPTHSQAWLVPYVKSRTCGIDPVTGVNPQQLIEWAEAAVARNTQAWTVHVSGLAYFRAGDFERAIEELERSNELEWNKLSIIQNWLVLAMAHSHLRQQQQAWQWLQRANEAMVKVGAGGTSAWSNTYAPDWLALRLLHRQAEDLIFDSEAFQRLIAAVDDDHEIWIARARYRLRNKQLREAITDYEQVIDAIDLGNEAFEYACLLVLSGELDRYGNLCKQLWEQWHGNVEQQDLAHIVMKICTLSPQSPIDSRELLDWASALHERHPNQWNLFTLAKAQMRAGQYAESIESLEQCIEAGVPDWRVSPLLAMAFKHEQQADKAEEWLEMSSRKIAQWGMHSTGIVNTSTWSQLRVYHKEATELLE